MELVSAIKRAPRWAWVTAAGVGLGAAGLKLWNNRDKPPDEAVATDILDPSSPYPSPTSTGNPVATIVPPVIVSPGGGDFNQGVPVLQDLYVGAVANLIQSYENLWGPVNTTHMALLQGNAETIQALAMAGSAPNSATTQPEAILPFPVPAAQVPNPLPASTGASPSPCGTCKPPYPFCNEQAKSCYTVACASGTGGRKKGKWHLYKSRPDVYMGAKC